MYGRLGRESHHRKGGRVGGGGGSGQNNKEGARGKRERNREGETEVTRSKLMHGQLSSPEDRERQRLFMSMNECDIMGHRTKFTDTVERWKRKKKGEKKRDRKSCLTVEIIKT